MTDMAKTYILAGPYRRAVQHYNSARDMSVGEGIYDHPP